MRKAGKLLVLAQRQFGELSPADYKFFTKIADGRVADFSSDKNDENDPTKAIEWSNNRVLSADRINWLCTDKVAILLVTHQGIQIQGVRVEGSIDLDFVDLPFPLSLTHCQLDSELRLSNARLATLNLSGTHCGPIIADGLITEGDLFLKDGLRAMGEVRLIGAVIGGNFECDNSDFCNRNAEAIVADGIKISGNMYLGDGFRAIGEVRFTGANIGGGLFCDGGLFLNRGRDALSADGINVRGQVSLGDGFKAIGAVRFPGADIGGALNCRNGIFLNKSGAALSCFGFRVRGDLYIRDETEIRGHLMFVGAMIDGICQFLEMKAGSLNSLDLRGAHVSRLWDIQESWPEQGKLWLDGFTYDTIDDDAPSDWKSRVDWLQRQPQEDFCPQPYEQLASVLEKQGYERYAREIRIQKNIDRSKSEQKALSKDVAEQSRWTGRVVPRLRLILHKTWNSFLFKTIRFGYKPWLVWRGALFFVVIGAILFALGDEARVMTPTGSNPPKFNALGYSLDEFLPIVDLHYGSQWMPNSDSTATVTVAEKIVVSVSGSRLRYYLWLHIISGWVLASLLVASLTGIIKK